MEMEGNEIDLVLYCKINEIGVWIVKREIDV